MRQRKTIIHDTQAPRPIVKLTMYVLHNPSEDLLLEHRHDTAQTSVIIIEYASGIEPTMNNSGSQEGGYL